jgi:hypothetical protein
LDAGASGRRSPGSRLRGSRRAVSTGHALRRAAVRPEPGSNIRCTNGVTRLLVLLAVPSLFAAAHVSGSARPVVSCESAIMLTEPARPSVERVLFDRVAVPPRDLLQVVRVGGRWPYWRKAGVLVRASSPLVTIAVPPAWRSRAALTWGDSGVVAALRFAPCSTHRWNAYAGGFYVRRPACIPLTVSVDGRTTEVRFGIGRRCERGSNGLTARRQRARPRCSRDVSPKHCAFNDNQTDARAKRARPDCRPKCLSAEASPTDRSDTMREPL